MTRLTTILVCAAACVPALVGQTGVAVPELASVDRDIPALMAAARVPGGAVAIVKDGRLIFALGFPSVGDGVYGMRRAFIVAGVRSQVMTLWQVDQASTFELLGAFANSLHAGKGKAEALRDAQRQVLRKNPHPYCWAGFYFSC